MVFVVVHCAMLVEVPERQQLVFYFQLDNLTVIAHLIFFVLPVAILGVHTLVTSTQSYDGTSSKDGYNSTYYLCDGSNITI